MLGRASGIGSQSTDQLQTMAHRPLPVEFPAEDPDRRLPLGESQLTTLRRYGQEVLVGGGEILFTDGDETYDMAIVLEGGVEVFEHLGQSDARLISAYGPREFICHMGLLAGQSIHLSAVATFDSKVLRIAAAHVKGILSEEPI